MYRALIFCIFFLSAGLAQAAIYHWVDLKDTTNYSQRPPHNKSIPSQKIIINNPVTYTEPQKSIQESANEIAKSNATRKAANDSKQQAAEKNRQLQARCDTSKKNLAVLNYGGNRLYKDFEGNYSRLSAEDKTKKRVQLNAFINENCR